MLNDLERLRTLLREGSCCSVALVQLGLELRGERNDQLLQAMGALCGGIQGGLACGALTGAACMMNVLAPDSARDGLVRELTEWFAATMHERHGGADCSAIVDGNPVLKAMRCPGLVEETYLQARSLLEANGYEFD